MLPLRSLLLQECPQALHRTNLLIVGQHIKQFHSFANISRILHAHFLAFCSPLSLVHPLLQSSSAISLCVLICYLFRVYPSPLSLSRLSSYFPPVVSASSIPALIYKPRKRLLACFASAYVTSVSALSRPLFWFGLSTFHHSSPSDALAAAEAHAASTKEVNRGYGEGDFQEERPLKPRNIFSTSPNKTSTRSRTILPLICRTFFP